ncbi:non-ribosomal peptide synthetase [Williamsia herbipolensis]|uniref:non-ribosomal peptide synthetase n=1 Tax=Williamsia herbipolensis TaxID=1603258 RepID=UPI000824C836|nr:non-ribosomal peptide synthetase [Williamsia herbipolensis]
MVVDTAVPTHEVSADVVSTVGQALGVDPADLDPHGDLIAQGLDSLRMMRLAGHWRKRGHDIDFARLAQEPTIDAWSRLLAGQAAAAQPADEQRADTAADDDPSFPLAPMQHAYWVGRSDSHDLGGVAAHLYVEFDGAAIDPERFRGAVAALLERHPMTRVAVAPDGTQRVGSAHPDTVRVHDLRRRSDQAVEEFLAQQRHQNTHAMLPVEDGQVVRTDLTLLPRGRTRVHLDVDMIAADAMSFRVLVDDLARLYRGEQLTPLRTDFRTLSAERTSRPARDADIAWWQARLDDLPGPPELPRTDPTGPASTPAGTAATVRLHHVIDAADRERLETHAHSRGVTPATAVAAVFAEAVGTHSATSRFLLTVPLFDRDATHPDVERVVGDFTSSLVVAVDLTAPRTLAERAVDMRAAMHDAAAHGTVSGLDVLRDLSRRRGEPVVSPVVFTSALGLGELFSPAVTEVFGTPTWIVSQGPQVLLDAQVTEIDGGLLVNWDVRASDLDPAVAQSMFDHYVALLDLLIAGDWERPAPSSVPAEVIAERRAVEHPLPVTDTFDGTLHRRLLDLATHRADTPALIDGESTWTHGELADRARRVAGALRAAGVGAGDTVVVTMPKSAAQIVAAVGVLAAGATYVPISPSQPDDRRDRIVAVATPAAVLTDRADRVTDTALAVVVFDDTASDPPLEPADDTSGPDSLAYILFTSGSTGTPKGVEVPHRAAVATLTDLTDRYRLDATDRALMVSSLEFDLSVFDIFALLAVGGAVVVGDDDPTTRVDSWARTLHEQSVTVLNCVPTVLGMLLDISDMPASLRVVLTGGDRVEVANLRRIAEQVPGVGVAGLGGTTETAIHSTVCALADVGDHTGFVPYGTPLRGVRCRVVDAIGRDRPDFVPGELWIGGDGVAAGYRGDPDRTAERFVEVDGVRWYRTGDVARYLPGAFLDFLGRDDHMVKIRGHRVELGEVEAALLRLGPVSAAVAWTDGRDLRAAVTIGAAETPEPTDLADALRDLLPAHMIPRSITVADRLPLTPNGKLDRARVAAEFGDAGSAESIAPRMPVEKALVTVLETILDTRPIGVTDEFVALGGDSVLATRFVAQIRRWLAVPGATASVTVADIFTHRTVAGLATRLDELHGASITEVAEVMLDVLGLSAGEVASELGRTSPAITHRRIDLDTDVDLVHRWLTHPKSHFWDMASATRAEVVALITHADAGGFGMRLGIVDGDPQFLFELYEPRTSELADAGTGYVHEPGDIGMHLLVAPTDAPVAGFTASVMRHIMRTAFGEAEARRVVVEPDVRNTAVHRLNELVGFRVEGDHPVGAKMARLSYCTADDFAATESGDS